MVFHVMVRNREYCSMNTFKESGKKKYTLMVVRPRRSIGVLQLFALLLSPSLYFSLQNQPAKHVEKRKQCFS